MVKKIVLDEWDHGYVRVCEGQHKWC